MMLMMIGGDDDYDDYDGCNVDDGGDNDYDECNVDDGDNDDDDGNDDGD